MTKKHLELRGLFPGIETPDTTLGPRESVNNEDLFPSIRASITQALTLNEAQAITTIIGLQTQQPKTIIETAEILRLKEKETEELYQSALIKLKVHLIALDIFAPTRRVEGKPDRLPTNVILFKPEP